MNGKSPNTQKLESLRSNRSFWEHQTGAGKMWFLSFYGSFDIKSPLPGFIMYFTASLVQKLEAAPFVLVGPTSPVAAVAGQGVMLPCSLHPRRNAANMTVRWTRVADVVHHYSSGQDQYEEQGLSYHGRTGLSKEGLVSGSMALHIVAVRPADEGQYVCFVQDGSDYERATLTLEVAAPFYLGVFPWMVALIVTLVAWTGSLVLIAYLLKTKDSPQNGAKKLLNLSGGDASCPSRKRIQVLLDYTTGQVVFSDADSWAMIFIFPLFLPARERLYPWLWLGEAGTHLGVCT
ncbi:myelin-oligodendrocyte glycoprotein-like isoform X6 [Rhea pennata]|uniref:myelin-oligodendrocyte glycoprotein-like isoform X6 n=1 Tax=Rhea pennata TaxID=8795 RepID=UPI002E25BC4F